MNFKSILINPRLYFFGKGNTRKEFIPLSGELLEIVHNFKYFGVLFCKNGSFNNNIRELFQKATKAMYGVIGKCRKHNLAVDCSLDMFTLQVKQTL